MTLLASKSLPLTTDSDVVKDEGKNRISRDEDILASGSGIVATGTVLGKIAASGKFKPLKPSATDGTETAAAIILHYADATAADVPIVNLKRHAQVVGPALVWPAGITAPQKAAALVALEAFGIVSRTGV